MFFFVSNQFRRFRSLNRELKFFKPISRIQKLQERIKLGLEVLKKLLGIDWDQDSSKVLMFLKQLIIYRWLIPIFGQVLKPWVEALGSSVETYHIGEMSQHFGWEFSTCNWNLNILSKFLYLGHVSGTDMSIPEPVDDFFCRLSRPNIDRVDLSWLLRPPCLELMSFKRFGSSKSSIGIRFGSKLFESSHE